MNLKNFYSIQLLKEKEIFFESMVLMDQEKHPLVLNLQILQLNLLITVFYNVFLLMFQMPEKMQ